MFIPVASVWKRETIAWKVEPKMPSTSDVAGQAALAICESLLLALNDRKVLPEIEILAVLVDAAAAHTNAPADGGQATAHQAVASVIQKIIDGGNYVGRR